MVESNKSSRRSGGKQLNRFSDYAEALNRKYAQAEPRAEDEGVNQAGNQTKSEDTRRTNQSDQASDDFAFEQILSTKRPVWSAEAEEETTSGGGAGLSGKGERPSRAGRSKVFGAKPLQPVEDQPVMEDSEVVEASTRLWPRVLETIKTRKYLLALIPLLFLALFLLAGEQVHSGSIKTPAFSYQGQILDDAPDGKGLMTYPNGDSYDGSFKAGKFSGLGTFVSKSGNWTFVGTFKDGVANGKGTLTAPDGSKHVASYKNGVLVR